MPEMLFSMPLSTSSGRAVARMSKYAYIADLMTAYMNVNSGQAAPSCPCSQLLARSQVEIRRHHDHVSDRHAATAGQHEDHHFGDFAGLQQASRDLGLFELLWRPVRK